jgi:hypothetical protein
MKPRTAMSLGILLAAMGSLCPAVPVEAQSLSQLKQIQARYQDDVLRIPGVVGMGIGRAATQRLVFRVLVRELTPELDEAIPTELDGVPVQIEAVGDVGLYGQSPGGREGADVPRGQARR